MSYLEKGFCEAEREKILNDHIVCFYKNSQASELR